MEPLLKLVLELPSEWQVILTLIVVFLYFMPNISMTLRESWLKKGLFEKKRTILELLKLRYEAEGIREKYGLPDMLTADERAVLEESVWPKEEQLPYLRRKTRSRWGALGGVVLSVILLLQVAFDDVQDIESVADAFVVLLISPALIIGLAYVGASMIPSRRPFQAVLIGFFFSFVSLIPLALIGEAMPE
jgi:hypothetical protein